MHLSAFPHNAIGLVNRVRDMIHIARLAQCGLIHVTQPKGVPHFVKQDIERRIERYQPIYTGFSSNAKGVEPMLFRVTEKLLFRIVVPGGGIESLHDPGEIRYRI